MSSDSNSDVVALADTVSDLLYGIAGWSLVVLALMLAGTGGRVLVEFDPTMATAIGATILFGLAFVTAAFGVFVNPRFRDRLDRRHAVTEFGRVRSVDRRVVRPEENCSERCVSCQDPVEKGLVRRYREEYALAGIPVSTKSVGYNYYCLDCASRDVLGEPPENQRATDFADRSEVADETGDETASVDGSDEIDEIDESTETDPDRLVERE